MTTSLLISSIEIDGAGTLEIYATQSGDDWITFQIKTADGWNTDYNLDLNGLFLDFQDGGSVKLTADGEKANNLNGLTYEGEKIYWDLATGTDSTVGGSDGETSLMECSVIVQGLTLGEIDGGLIGIRATSTGVDGEGSLKLVGEIIVPVVELAEEPTDSYPEFTTHDISHVILAFDTEDGDVKGGEDGSGDGYYTVKIDNWDGSNDLDAELDAILTWLIENDANIDADTDLVGAQLKGGNVGTADGSYDDFWLDDGGADTIILEFTKKNGTTITEITSGDDAPLGLDIDQDSQTNIDVTYQYDDLFGTFA